jgi:hypothetical protein
MESLDVVVVCVVVDWDVDWPDDIGLAVSQEDDGFADDGFADETFALGSLT